MGEPLTQRASGAGSGQLLLQGECKVSADPDVVLTTLLGSCVAACLHDPEAKVGGMNHFLVPFGSAGCTRSERFGIHAMEVLINDLLKLGAQKSRLQAKLFGAAVLEEGMSFVGKENARFAKHFLEHEGIPCVASSLGGRRGRRLRYVPTTGMARLFWIESAPPQRPIPPARDHDDVIFSEE